jgi:membrane protein
MTEVTDKSDPGFRAHFAAHFRDGQILLTASSLAYTTLLSLIPLLAVTFAILKRVGGLDRLYGELEPLIVSNLAAGTGDQVIGSLQKFIHNTHSSAIGVTGFLGLAITTVLMLNGVEDAFNRVWTGTKTRSLLRRAMMYAIFIVTGPLTISLIIGLSRGLSRGLSPLVSELVAVTSFTLVYKLIPNTFVDWRWSLLSGFWTSVILQLARWAYRIYITRYVPYHLIYGSLAALPILLLWIYILWVIILTGAVLGASAQKYFTARSEPLRSKD